jgi:hypothetical protein
VGFSAATFKVAAFPLLDEMSRAAPLKERAALKIQQPARTMPFAKTMLPF